MAEKFTLTNPHPDIELGFPRKPIDYFVTTPIKGINKKIGLVFFIPGFGMLSDSAYVLEKLSPYIADKYNCLVVSVNYFGIHNRPETGAYYRLADNFFDKFLECYHIEARVDAPQLAVNAENLPALQNFANSVLGQISKTFSYVWLDPRCQVLLRYGKEEYESFGLLPAIDYLQITGEILKNYPIDTRKIIILGSSYGGYIANLMGKFAPNTFSNIIDNSGFTQASIHHIASRDVMVNAGYSKFENMQCDICQDSAWTIKDETSPYYFSDSHRKIRSLVCNEHYQSTSTQYHIFHSTKDILTATIEDKDKQVNHLKKYAKVFYHRIEEKHLDGQLFKTLEHGMQASMRKLFDFAFQEDKNQFYKAKSENDFTLNKTHTFYCGEWNYRFNFKDDYSLNISRDKTPTPQ